jgi:hypothetical protein
MLLKFIIVISILVNFAIGVCFLMEAIIRIRFKEVALVLSQIQVTRRRVRARRWG